MEILQLNGIMDQYDDQDKNSISLWGTQERRPTSSMSYLKANAKIRRSNSKEKLKMSILHPFKGDYNVLTIDKD
jgi:lipocalin